MATDTPKDPTVTGASGKFDLAQALKNAPASTQTTGTGAVWTEAEGNAYVQNVWQSLLGRNAVGNEYAQALNLFMNQDPNTGYQGRTQALVNMVQQTPEFATRQDNKYLDAIYNEIAKNVQKARQ